jgi:hypothetical protein
MSGRPVIFLLLAAGALAQACTPSFAAPSDVSDLRVLAVQAEPPEAQFDAQGNVQDVQVRVLAADPGRGGIASMDATLCAPTDSGRCDTGPSLPLPRTTRTGGTEFATTVSGALLSPLLAYALESDKLKGLGGIRVQFSIAVRDGDPNEPATAGKTLLYSPSGGVPNQNPLLAGINLTRAGVPSGTLAPGQTLELPLGVEIGMRPVLADGAQEEYDTIDLQGKPIHLKEQAHYAFFVTPGAEVDRDTADEPLDGVAPSDGLSRVDSFNRGTGTLWVVVRDGRGGESWLAFPWTSL